MKFIGGPAHGKPLPQWLIDSRPMTVIVRESEDSLPADNDGWTGAGPVSHTYSRERWRRGSERFDFYVFHKLSDAEIDSLSRKEFS